MPVTTRSVKNRAQQIRNETCAANEALPHKVTHVNLTMREIVEMRRSSERLISLLNEIETQYLTSHMNTASHN